MDKKTICLNMIVKNESHIILHTLKNILEHINIDYWVISDTGSTDNTVAIIEGYFKEKNIDGQIYHDKWKDFGYNRTKAIEHAFNKTDYLFIFDADDLIHGNMKLPTVLDKDLYNLQFENPVSYYRGILISNRMKWKYQGVLHEYLVNIDPIKSEQQLVGNYHIQSRRLGDRSKNPNKYFDDAVVLEKGFHEENTDMWLKYRYAYYCAQSYNDANKLEKAIEWYEKTLTLDYSPQYHYCACVRAGDCYFTLKQIDKAINIWGKSYNYDKERLEGIVKIMEYYYNNGKHFMVSALYNKFKHNSIGNASDKIFLDYSKYDDFHYFGSISGCYCDDHKSAYYACKYLLLNNWKFTENTISNLQFYMNHFKEDKDKKPLIDFFINYIKHPSRSVTDRKNAWDRIKDITKEEYPDKYKLLSSLFYKTIDKNSKYAFSKKILVYTGWMTYLWNESHLDTKALGGSEKAVAYLMYELSKYSDYEIIISGHVEDGVFGNRRYINEDKLQPILDSTEFHTIIISRNINFLTIYRNIKCFQLLLSLHDTCILNDHQNSILDVYNSSIDKVITLTPWHKSNTTILYPTISPDKIEIVNNGIDLLKFTNIPSNNKVKNKFIWSSRTERGLSILLKIWCDILEKFPDATLDICSYGDFPKDDDDRNMLEIINKYDKSITYHGKLDTKELYNLMSLSEYWLYTNTFPETSCITAMEMLMSEVICLYYPNAGLNDTIGEYGIKVKRGEEIDELLKLTTEKKTLLRENGKKYAFTCSWKNRAEEWINLLDISVAESCSTPIDNNNLLPNYHIHVINLKHRTDRKENMIQQFKDNNIENYKFYDAIHGIDIKESLEIMRLFEGNDFNYKKGVIGCALSHITLWNQLLNDQHHDFYVILEDDVTIFSNFKEILNITINKFINGNYLHVLIGGNETNYENLIREENETNKSHETKVYFKDNGYYKDNKLIKDTAEGAWGYILHKNGAKKLIDYVNNNSIKYAIDHPEIFIKHTNPMFINKNIINAISTQVHFNSDTDIQTCNECFNFEDTINNTNQKQNTSLFTNWFDKN